MLGDSEQTSLSCVFLYLSCRHRYMNAHIAALAGLRRISHGTWSLNPAQLGPLTSTLVNEVPLPCQLYGVLWAVSFYLRKEKRL